MKKLAMSVWRSYKFEVIAFFLGLGGAGVLIYFTRRELLAPSDTIQIITLIVLVIVTFSYAKSTHKIYGVASNSERNAVFPIVNLTADVTTQDQIRISYQNIGRGPALNLKIWLELDYDGQFGYLKSEEMKNRGFRAALGVGQEGQREWNRSEGVLPTRTSGIDIVAEYTDVFRQGFQSKLVIVNAYDQGFHFGKKDEE